MTNNELLTGYTADPMNQYTKVGGTALAYDGNFNLSGCGIQTRTTDPSRGRRAEVAAAIQSLGHQERDWPLWTDGRS